jgi:hypothetical protein
VTFGFLYYNDKSALIQQILGWSEWPTELKLQIEFIVFDDCSSDDERAAGIIADVVDGLDLTVKVITAQPPKRTWNIGGGRNSIMSEAKGCWVMLMDIDFKVPVKLTQNIVSATRNSRKRQVFKFTRIVPNKGIYFGKNGTQHPAIALLHRDLYWEAGGCDEDFVGAYGYTDPHFWFRLLQHEIKPKIIVDVRWPSLLLVRTEEDPDFVWNINKNTSRNSKIFQEKTSGSLAWSNNYLRFDRKVTTIGWE